jgi:hypothetical protein
MNYTDVAISELDSHYDTPGAHGLMPIFTEVKLISAQSLVKIN